MAKRLKFSQGYTLLRGLAILSCCSAILLLQVRSASARHSHVHFSRRQHIPDSFISSKESLHHANGAHNSSPTSTNLEEETKQNDLCEPQVALSDLMDTELILKSSVMSTILDKLEQRSNNHDVCQQLRSLKSSPYCERTDSDGKHVEGKCGGKEYDQKVTNFVNSRGCMSAMILGQTLLSDYVSPGKNAAIDKWIKQYEVALKLPALDNELVKIYFESKQLLTSLKDSIKHAMSALSSKEIKDIWIERKARITGIMCAVGDGDADGLADQTTVANDLIVIKIQFKDLLEKAHTVFRKAFIEYGNFITALNEADGYLKQLIYIHRAFHAYRMNKLAPFLQNSVHSGTVLDTQGVLKKLPSVQKRHMRNKIKQHQPAEPEGSSMLEMNQHTNVESESESSSAFINLYGSLSSLDTPQLQLHESTPQIQGVAGNGINLPYPAPNQVPIGGTIPNGAQYAGVQPQQFNPQQPNIQQPIIQQPQQLNIQQPQQFPLQQQPQQFPLQQQPQQFPLQQQPAQIFPQPDSTQQNTNSPVQQHVPQQNQPLQHPPQVAPDTHSTSSPNIAPSQSQNGSVSEQQHHVGNAYSAESPSNNVKSLPLNNFGFGKNKTLFSTVQDTLQELNLFEVLNNTVSGTPDEKKIARIIDSSFLDLKDVDCLLKLFLAPQAAVVSILQLFAELTPDPVIDLREWFDMTMDENGAVTTGAVADPLGMNMTDSVNRFSKYMDLTYQNAKRMALFKLDNLAQMASAGDEAGHSQEVGTGATLAQPSAIQLGSEPPNSASQMTDRPYKHTASEIGGEESDGAESTELSESQDSEAAERIQDSRTELSEDSPTKDNSFRQHFSDESSNNPDFQEVAHKLAASEKQSFLDSQQSYETQSGSASQGTTVALLNADDGFPVESQLKACPLARLQQYSDYEGVLMKSSAPSIVMHFMQLGHILALVAVGLFLLL